MKTVRFTQVIEQSGQPEVYLLFMKPEKDPEFQKALKANRIMTVHTGAKTDFGAVGYQGDAHAQILIFPRSLKGFEGKNVVGIKYDLLHEEPDTAQRPAAAKAKKELPPSKIREKKGEEKKKPAKPAPLPVEKIEKGKVLEFPATEKEEEDSDDDSEIKAKVRRAVKALEDGKQVAAFNILKSILES